MKTSSSGIKLICAFESLHDGNPKTSVCEPMLDCSGIPTIGYGCTSYANGKAVSLKDKPLTSDECQTLLAYHLHVVENAINTTNVLLNQNQFDALVSLVFNIGVGNFKASTLLKRLKANQYALAAEQFLVWNKSKGKVLKGLVNRRSKEKALFLS